MSAAVRNTTSPSATNVTSRPSRPACLPAQQPQAAALPHRSHAAGAKLTNLIQRRARLNVFNPFFYIHVFQNLFGAKAMPARGKKTCFLFPERSLHYAKAMPASGKKACFLFPERSLHYTKAMPASGKKACFLFPERSLHYTNIARNLRRIKGLRLVFASRLSIFNSPRRQGQSWPG